VRHERRARDAESWSGTDLSAQFASVRCPVLILAPGASRIMPRDIAFGLEALLPDAHLVLFGAGTVPRLS